ncbi:MAG: ABC transporter ATP-binding protein [Acidimicrobiia bacterium]|nr:ABC transporter ATP-binding protein [Acidimicrobiia bacterium]
MLLEVDNLAVEFRTDAGVVNAVNRVSFNLKAGETMAIIGESGSGKSVTAQAIMGIVPSPPGVVTADGIRYRGADLEGMTDRQRRRVRGDQIAMIFQDPLTSLNPVYSVGFQIGEMFRVHRGMSRKEARERSIELMDRVRIPEARRRVGDYPHQFSGGMRQRVMVAMALALEPTILIADEPTTALDVTVQAQIMEILHDLQEDNNMGLILITHDLGVVASVSDSIMLMYAGSVVEKAPADDFYADPAHPYAHGLMKSVPRLIHQADRLDPIEGAPPSLLSVPPGCPFNPRCPHTQDRCRDEVPDLRTIPGYVGQVACHFAEEVQGG